jgi:hypothetical protein
MEYRDRDPLRPVKVRLQCNMLIPPQINDGKTVGRAGGIVALFDADFKDFFVNLSESERPMPIE